MEDTQIATTQPDTTVEDVTLVALTPSEMAPAQAALAEWCDAKITAVRAELADLNENHETMCAAGLRQKGIVPLINRTEKRIAYYEKIKAAVEAGYLIVPNFPVDVFALRVARGKQPVQETDYKFDRSYRTATAQKLPAGEGRYVDDQLDAFQKSHTEKSADGKDVVKYRYYSGDYREVDFPVIAVKPVVLKATERAMGLRIFDELGTVQNNVGRDPIIVGRLLDPRGNGRMTTFFIAWWLDTATL